MVKIEKISAGEGSRTRRRPTPMPRAQGSTNALSTVSSVPQDVEDKTPRGHFYRFLKAKMFGRRQVQLIPKYAYVTQGPNGSFYSEFVTEKRKQEPYRPGAERMTTIKPFRSADGTKYRMTREEIFDPDRAYFGKAVMRVDVPDNSYILAPSIQKNGRNYAKYTDPRTGQEKLLFVPKGSAGVLLQDDGRGNKVPYVRKWFPYTMSGIGKDLAYEDAQFVNHSKHVYAEMYKQMAMNEKLSPMEARKIAEENIRQREANGDFDDEKGYDQKVLRDRLFANLLDSKAKEVVQETLGRGAFTPGNVKADVKFRKEVEKLKKNLEFQKKIQAVVANREARIKVQAEMDAVAYETAEEDYWERYSYYEGEYLDRFWNNYLAEHNATMDNVKEVNGQIVIEGLTPTQEELESGHARTSLSMEDIERMNATAGQAAYAEYVQIYSPNYRTAQDIANADPIDTKRAYIDDLTRLTARRDGVDYDSLSADEQEQLRLNAEAMFDDMDPMKKKVALSKYIRTAQVEMEKEQSQEPPEVKKEREKWHDPRWLMENGAGMPVVVEQRKQQAIQDAQERIARLEANPTPEYAAVKASKAMGQMTADVNRGLETVGKVKENLKTSQSNYDTIVDNTPVFKVLRLLQRDILNGGSPMLMRDDALGKAVKKVVNNVAKGYMSDPVVANRSIENVLENWTDTPEQRKAASEYIKSLMRNVRNDIVNHGVAYQSADLDLVTDWLEARSKINAGKVRDGQRILERTFSDLGMDLNNPALQLNLSDTQNWINQAEKMLGDKLTAIQSTPEYQNEAQKVAVYNAGLEARQNARREKREAGQDLPEVPADMSDLLEQNDAVNEARMEDLGRLRGFLTPEGVQEIDKIRRDTEGTSEDRHNAMQAKFNELYPGQDLNWDTFYRNYPLVAKDYLPSDTDLETKNKEIEDKYKEKTQSQLKDLEDKGKLKGEPGRDPKELQYEQFTPASPMDLPEPDDDGKQSRNWFRGVDITGKSDEEMSELMKEAQRFALQARSNVYQGDDGAVYIIRDDPDYADEPKVVPTEQISDDHRAKRQKFLGGFDAPQNQSGDYTHFDIEVPEAPKETQPETPAPKTPKVVTDTTSFEDLSADEVSQKQADEYVKNRNNNNSFKRSGNMTDEDVSFKDMLSIAKSDRDGYTESQLASQDEDPMSFRNMLRKANDEQAEKRGAPPTRVMGPNVCGGTMPNFGPSDRDANTPVEPKLAKENEDGATRKEISI